MYNRDVAIYPLYIQPIFGLYRYVGYKYSIGYNTLQFIYWYACGPALNKFFAHYVQSVCHDCISY